MPPQAIDGWPTHAHHLSMSFSSFQFPSSRPVTVGSAGDTNTLVSCKSNSLAEECEMLEIRLDLLHQENPRYNSNLWQHLRDTPLLFTARCRSEGSPIDLDVATRQRLLQEALPSAAVIDIEVANIVVMGDFLKEIKDAKIPWIASYHDFVNLPSRHQLETQAEIARTAGAAAFKCAAQLTTVRDLADLADFQMSDQGIPLATMGMGALAPVSRMLCAQAGSVLNYGYIGTTETAPGQWSAKQLREAIRSLSQL